MIQFHHDISTNDDQVVHILFNFTCAYVWTVFSILSKYECYYFKMHCGGINSEKLSKYVSWKKVSFLEELCRHHIKGFLNSHCMFLVSFSFISMLKSTLCAQQHTNIRARAYIVHCGWWCRIEVNLGLDLGRNLFVVDLFDFS